MITRTASGTETYSRAVEDGNYDLYQGNLSGKYDSVRTLWEDQLTRMSLRPVLTGVVDRLRQAGRGLRILDLGCGSGQGYQLLTQIDRTDLDLGLEHDRVLPEDCVQHYLGLDLSEAMVKKGKKLFHNKPQARFAQADLQKGLGWVSDSEPAFDIYFSSYGSLSHLSRGHLEQLARDVCAHAGEESFLVLDLIGRYSIEWPAYWQAETETEKVREYSMSYLYSAEERTRGQIERFNLRFWTGAEVRELTGHLQQATGRTVDLLCLMDRSVLVGRHTVTGEYNPRLKPIRRMINSLHQDYMRTDLSKLILDPAMIPDHPEIAPFLRELVRCWNVLIDFCQKRLRGNLSVMDTEGWAEFPAPLQHALMNIDRVIADTGWMYFGDPRANIIEPQLAYAIRGLEHHLQQGMGCGHALWAVLRIS